MAPDSTVDFPTLYPVTPRQYIPSLFLYIILVAPWAYTANIMANLSGTRCVIILCPLSNWISLCRITGSLSFLTRIFANFVSTFLLLVFFLCLLLLLSCQFLLFPCLLSLLAFSLLLFLFLLWFFGYTLFFPLFLFSFFLLFVLFFLLLLCFQMLETHYFKLIYSLPLALTCSQQWDKQGTQTMVMLFERLTPVMKSPHRRRYVSV